MRAAIYARYSSDRQDERSIEDQVRLCREAAARLGGGVAGIYADYAISGAHLKSRPEACRLLEDAKAGQFEIVIAEALDRLSRDQEDVAHVFKRLTFAGVRIHTLAEGEVGELHIGMKGTMNALFLKDLAAKIRRGMIGRVAKGLSAGGRAYGYKVVRRLGPDGEPERGLRTIEPAEAETVKRIFRDYIAGHSPRAIAAALNREGVPAPGGGIWNASTINGNRTRRNGILQNEAYCGRLVFNRLRMVKNPDTGKRLSRPNPRAEWVVRDVPELRIVDEDDWKAAQALKARHSHAGFQKSRRPRHLFSGLVRCGICGGAMTVYQTARLSCARRRESGTCTHDRTVTIAELERRVLIGIKEKLLAPETLAHTVKQYHDTRARGRAVETARLRAINRRLRELGPDIKRLVMAIAKGTASPAIEAQLTEWEAEKARLEGELAAITQAPKVIEFHPGVIDAYRRVVADIESADLDPEARAEVGTILRRIIARIDVLPAAGRGRTDIRVHGLIPQLLAGPESAGLLMQVVAEVRYRLDQQSGFQLVVAC